MIDVRREGYKHENKYLTEHLNKCDLQSGLNLFAFV